jgi:RHS repeat-associated protein
VRYEYGAGLALAAGNERLLHDGLGSVVGRIGNGAPTLYRFDAWGGYRGGAPSVTEPSAGYAGQHWDADAGLSYAQQRWYDPRIGRFLSEDPVFGDLTRPNSLHAFGYANGNPLLFIDPLGEASRKIFFRQEIEGLSREAKEAALAQIDPVLAKASYLDMGRYTDEQLVSGICTNLDAACDESGAEWLWERGQRKFGPGLQAFADRVSQSPAADAVRAVRSKAGEIDESLRDTATGSYRQALGPTAGVIANRLPADAAPQVLAQTQAMSRKLGDATVDTAEELGRTAVETYAMGAVIKGVGALGKGAGEARSGVRVLFGQSSVKNEFSHGPFKGKTIGEVAAGLRSGKYSPDQLPLDVIVRNGETVTLNNRSLTTLRRAGMEPTKVIDRTGDRFFEELLNSHLAGSSPSDSIRIRGGAPNASSLE